jgi:hypothetical protein
MSQRKRQRIDEQVTQEQEYWSRPFTLIENLEGSVKSLTSSNDTVKLIISNSLAVHESNPHVLLVEKHH